MDTQVQPQAQHLKLRCTEGTRDAAYNLHLKPAGDGWIVTYQNGRWGSTLQDGSKTPDPVDYPTAKKIFDAVLREKMQVKHYYILDGEAAEMVASAKTVARSEWQPMLVTHRGTETAPAYLTDNEWGMQEKYNGFNRIAGTDANAAPFGTNKRGEPVALPPGLAKELTALHKLIGGRIVMAGEAMGERLIAHDCLWSMGDDLRVQEFRSRYNVLEIALDELGGDVIELAPLYTLTKAKKLAYERLLDQRKEGVVFKLLGGLYVPGRSDCQIALKFTETTGVIVAKGRDGKASFGMEMIDDASGQRVFVGNCSVPKNKQMPEV